MTKTVTISAIKQSKPLTRVLGFFSPYKKRIAAVIIVGIIGIVMYSFMPTFLRDALDGLEHLFDPVTREPNGLSLDLGWLLTQLAIFGVLALFNEAFAIFCSFTIINFENKVRLTKLTEVKHKLDIVPISFLEKFSVGDLTRRIANLTDEIIKGVPMAIYTIARVVFFFITTSIMMFFINWILALVVVMSVPLCLLTARFVSKRTQKFFNNYTASAATAYGYVDQKMSLRAFYHMHGLDGGNEEFDQVNEKLTKTMIGENTSIAFNTIYITLIQNFMYLLVTVLFGVMFLTGGASLGISGIGVLTAFLFYSNRFLSNAVVVTTATNLIQAINSRAAKVFELLDCPEDVTEKERLWVDRIEGDIEFRDVTYTRNREKLLDDVSFTIKKGTNVAFVGPTGCGKSRIVELLAKLAVPTKGRITIDGKRLDEIKSKGYYRRVGLASENPFIFKGTIAENLLYGCRKKLPEQVVEVTQSLGSHEFISQLEKRYETPLNENTMVLSQSQKQAINVARTVLQAPDLVIIDEALSNADTVTEKATFEAIMAMDPNQTTVFVTHRLASIQKCDQIIFMEHGRIIEQGTHDQLMKKKRSKYCRALTKSIY